MWTNTRRCPAPFGTADAAKAAFILSHDQDRTFIFDWPGCDDLLSLGFKVF
jgi:hypothetical protein